MSDKVYQQTHLSPLHVMIRTDVYFIIHRCKFREFSKVDFVLLELFPIEPGELHIVQLPVKLYMFASADFARRSFHNGWCEEVDCFKRVS